jgi:hypothetical protein
MQKRIQFLYHPSDIEHKQHAIEKADINGAKRRYLKGIASGTQVDGHGERITDKCIKSFHEQANKGDILLYADRHGVAYSDDIGILTKSEVTPIGDWAVEFRLYDKADGVGANTLETADKIWRQVNGLPPYKKPKQKGFSIEGFIPDGGILAMSTDGKRLINEVVLDGCVLVPRPAYRTSVAQALYKALDEVPPWNIEKAVENTFKKIISTDEIQNSYYRKRFQFQDALEEQIENVMGNDGMPDKQGVLEKLFEEYSEAMIDLIMGSIPIFDKSRINSDQHAEDKTDELYKSKTDRITVIKSMIESVDSFIAKFN